MVRVQLSRGKFALIDEEDEVRVLRYKWTYLRTQRGHEYATAQIDQKAVLMHRFILDAPAGKMVDHRNGGLDNRRENLRLATTAQNTCNSRPRSDSTTGYKGIKRNRRKWQARIRVDQKEIHLGSFSSKEDAARAYDDAAHKFFGEFARLNFPTK